MVGQKFGQLIVAREYRGSDGGTISVCFCRNCHRFIETRIGRLRRGERTSCGRNGNCRYTLNLDGAKRRTNRPLYSIWNSMNQRCYNSKTKGFRWYGAKGIEVFSEWRYSFEAFEKWALSTGYALGLSIERVDPLRDYCPDNCEWISRAENAKRARARKLEAVE